MNLRFVEAFYWVATLKSVSRAAEKLFITQSAMSSRIASLEDELGVQLLDRRDKQVRLTAAGSRFLVMAERLLSLQREIRDEMGRSGESAFSLRIGAIESVLHSWLIDWVREMRAAQPGLELELTVETTPVLVEQMRRGRLDLALAALPASGEGLRQQALPPMPMCFVGHAGLHRKRRYSLDDLAALELLTFQRGSQPHVALIDLMRQSGHARPRVHAISSVSAMAGLVEGGLGIATLPVAVVRRLAERQSLRVLPAEAEMPPLPIFLSYRDDPGSALTRTVVDALLGFKAVQPVPSKKSMKS
ncbi:LysR family transcriptional regulator [Ideonella sp. YS5]|uniref:LysR family transcriptional regulator n=1 Tax=Ideonella sp. YS5 TaxID=3453714 RepID=UPI003EEDB47C